MPKKKGVPTNPFVPAEEQPYPIPENWCWTRLGNITEVVGGGTPSSIRAKNITKLGLEKCSAQLMPSGTVCLSSRAPIGYVTIAKNELCTNQGFKNFLPATCYIPEYLYWYLKGSKELLESYASGTTFLELSGSKAALVEFPLAPVTEQQRIVSRIESLFAKLDEAKEKVQAVVDGFELRKSAILHKAFTGELTERWRKEHGVGLDSWDNRTLTSVCHSIFDGDHMPPPKSENGIPFLVISNVNDGHLSFENTRFVPQEYYDSLSETRKPQIGDVLYTLVGSYGIPIVVDDERPFCFQRHMALLKPKFINTYFLWYLLQSQEMFNKASEIATGTAQFTVPIKGLRMIEFLCPSKNEQAEIVCILDSLLAQDQQAKEAAEAVLSQIDTMKKAILARAFRGELGTNDPKEEWAGELLNNRI